MESENPDESENLEKRLNELEEKWFNKTITPEEAREYARWYNAHQEDPVEIPASFAGGDAELEARILQEIRTRTGQETPVVSMSSRRLMPGYLPLKRIAAAAIILFLSGSAAYLWIYRSVGPPVPPTNQVSAPSNDIAPPTGSKATLTLANGKHIALDSVQNGSFAQQGNATVAKLKDGQLVYTPTTGTPADLLYNILSTTKGGQTMVVLEDGTRVWLNALSSLRYPTAFNTDQRKVEVTGEAYFEVAPLRNKPFIVSARGMNILVLGTHFNIKAYTDEPAISTTLLTGRIRVTAGDGMVSRTLEPGEQARLLADGRLHVSRNADLDQAIAWKNGYFQFDRADIRTIMRQLARWYDLEVSYEGNSPDNEYVGQIRRNVSLMNVLKILELSKVRFKIEGKRVIVHQ